MKLFRIFLFILGFGIINSLFPQPLTIFNDSLVHKYWTADYSWDTEYKLNATDFVFEGNYSISVEYKKSFSGFCIFTANLNTTGYDTLVFHINGGNSSGQTFQIKVSFDGKTFNTGVNSSNYFFIEQNKWKEIRIALKDIGAADNFIELLAFQDYKGYAQPKYYLDKIYLTSISGNVKFLDTYMSSYNPYPGEMVDIQAEVSCEKGLNQIENVLVDLNELGITTKIKLYDDGLHKDVFANDGIFGNSFRIPESTFRSEYRIKLEAETKDKIKTYEKIWIGVLSKILKTFPAGFPNYLSLGTATTTGNLNWQFENGGACWDFGYQYITWDWWTWGSEFVKRFCNNAINKGYIPVIPIYQFQQAADKYGCSGSEYEKIYCAINNLQLMKEFWTRLIQMFQEAYQSNASKIVFHFEPDMLGYLQIRGRLESRTPNNISAFVDDSSYPNTLAGMMKRIADLMQIYCPNKGIFANHISLWSNEISLKDSKETYIAVDSLAKMTAEFLMQCTDKIDLFFIDWSDRDAGFDGVWWNRRNTSVPNFTRPILFANCIASYTNKKIVLWQVPIGNENQNNTDYHYADNRLDYTFDFPKDILKSGMISILYGAAIPKMTNQETDGGNLLKRAGDYCLKGKINFDKLDSISVDIPVNFELSQNYPNPFRSFTYFDVKLPNLLNSKTELSYELATLKIYNMLGQVVVTIFDEMRYPGNYKQIKFSAAKYNLPSGIYLAELRYGELFLTKKIMVLK